MFRHIALMVSILGVGIAATARTLVYHLSQVASIQFTMAIRWSADTRLKAMSA